MNLPLGIYVAAVVVAALLSDRFARRSPRAARWTLGAVGVGFVAQLVVEFAPEPVANAVGWSEVALVATAYPHLAAALWATARHVTSDPRVRRRITGWGIPLLGVASLGSAFPVPPLRLHRDWVDAHGVVRQTHPSSCAAASAATLLRRLEVDPDATEAELAEDCLTHPWRGTRLLGLYRGLALRLPGRTLRFERPPLRELPAHSVIFVGLSRERVRDPELYALLRDRCGWLEDQSHAVVFCGYDPGGPDEDALVARICDPRTGYERWGTSHFDVLWDGRALVVR